MTNETQLIQIVRRLRPSICGVGDYALLLARQLRSQCGLDTTFVVGDDTWTGDATSVDFEVRTVGRRSADELLAALDGVTRGRDAVVLVHYVGYAYARRGCPFWLIDGLERWRRQERTPIFTLFHELYGTGPIWTSGFWTSWTQRWLAARLARLSALSRTTTSVTAPQVRRMLGPSRSGEVEVAPVFSNVGEPPDLPPVPARRRQMVVFGGERWRVEAYTRYLTDLVHACRVMGIERIVDVGPPLPIRPELPLPFVQAGELPAGEVSELFSQSLAGYFTPPVPYLGKSTVFAAYCAHGMVPVTHADNLEPSGDGLRLGEHLLTANDPRATDPSCWHAVTAAAHGWYSDHSLERRARAFAEDVERLVRRPGTPAGTQESARR